MRAYQREETEPIAQILKSMLAHRKRNRAAKHYTEALTESVLTSPRHAKRKGLSSFDKERILPLVIAIGVLICSAHDRTAAQGDDAG